MTGFVLALAGLTAGDGGGRGRVSAEPVALSPAAISPDGRWVGTARQGAAEPVSVEWDNAAGVLTLAKEGRAAASFEVSGPRAVTLAIDGSVYRGAYTLVGDRLTFRANANGESVVITLRPAAPHKP